MKRERALRGVLAGFLLLVAYRARATPPPPISLPCPATRVGREGALAVCGGTQALSGSEAHVLGLPLDLNQATEAELERLPGIGTKLAERILRVRAAQGGFRRLDDLQQVEGIGAAKLELLRGRATVGERAP